VPEDEVWRRDFALQEIEVGLIFAKAAIEAYRSNRNRDGATAKARATTAMENVSAVTGDLTRNDQEVVRDKLVKLRYAVYALSRWAGR
jgi:hypothetical protein